jgi:uncharacterized protein involved in exopolysaccharide biosynthesis/Mrp family chromosome partitioning ATPase
LTSHRSPLATIPVGYPLTPHHPERERPLDLRRIFEFLIGSWLPILGMAAVFGGAAATYALTTPPTYSSTTQLMLNLGQTRGPDGASSIAEQAMMEGQIEVAQSNNVLAAVIRQHNLLEDPEFADNSVSIVGGLRDLLAMATVDPTQPATPAPAVEAPAAGEEDAAPGLGGVRPQDRVMARLRKQIWVRRVGQSPVIEIAVTSVDPVKAATLANAFAANFIAHNIAMKSSAARLSANWLAEQVKALQQKVFDAERAVGAFRSSGAPTDQYKLAELEAVADTTRDLYKTYLQRAAETRQQVSNPLSDATVLSEATVPIGKSHPRSSLIVALALVLGAGAGTAGAIVRRVIKREITSAERVRNSTGIYSVSTVRRLRRRTLLRRRSLPFPTLCDSSKTARVKSRFFRNDMDELRASLDGLRRRRDARIIGFVGADADVGATTMAFNLAWLWSRSGARTLLIDADSEHPTLSQTLGMPDGPGLTDLLEGTAQTEATLRGVTPSLSFLPIGRTDDVTPASRISSQRTAWRFSDVGDQFDLIIVDLPAMAHSADARSIAPHLDALVLVTRYGTTLVDQVVTLVDSLQEIGTEPISIVINQAPSVSQQR